MKSTLMLPIAKTKSDGIDICTYDEAYKNSCVELLRKTFPATRTDNVINWKSRAYKSTLPPLLVLAKEEDKVICFCSFFPLEFSFNGQRYVAYQAGDAATDPSMQKKGLWSRVIGFSIAWMHDHHADFMLGFPNSQSMPGSLDAGATLIYTLEYRIRPIMPFSRSVKLSSSDKKPPSQASFLSQKNMLTPTAGDEYAKWRYNVSCRIIDYRENNCLARFFVRCKKWKRINEILLLDFQYTSLDQTFVRNAFRFLDKTFAGNAFFIRTFFNENSDRGRVMNDFFPIHWTSRARRLVVLPISHRLSDDILMNRFSWDIMPHCIDDL